MAYTSLINGFPGEWSAPLEPSWSMYQSVWLREPSQLPRQMLVLTNNLPQFVAAEAMYKDGIAGQAVVPVVRTYSHLEDKFGNQLMELLFKSKLDDLERPGGMTKREGLIAELFPIEELLPQDFDPKAEQLNGNSPAWAKALAAIKMSTEFAFHPKTAYIGPDSNIRSWLTAEFRYMGMDKKWFYNQLDELQYELSRLANDPSKDVTTHQIGYGFVAKNQGAPELDLGSMPGEVLEINTRTKVQYLRDMNPLKYRDERVGLVYTTPAVAVLKRFLDVDNMEYEDLAANAAVLQSMFTNYGHPTFDNWLSMRDVNARMMMLFGTGIRKADPFKSLDASFYADMFDWALMTGLQNERTVPAIETVKLHLDSYELRSAAKLEFAVANAYPLEGYGSKAEPHFAVRSNVVPAGHFVLPVAVRHTRPASTLVGKSDDAKKSWKYTVNKLEWVDKEMWGDVQNSSIKGEDMSVRYEDFMKSVFYKLSFSSDAQRGETVRGLTDRSILMWRFPTVPLYTALDSTSVDIVNFKQQRFLWYVGLLSTGTSMLKSGIRIEPYFEMVRGVLLNMNIRNDGLGEMRIINADGKVDTKVVPSPSMQELGQAAIPTQTPRAQPEFAEKGIAVDTNTNKEAKPESK